MTAEATDAIAEVPGRPWSTYRVQLHHGFTFDDAAAVVGYLSDLGVTHLYCSPYLQAAAGSTHGYDVVNPRQLNSELGGPGAFARMVEAERAHQLGQVLDIVPNHMAVDGRANHWWWDVLANGPSSLYARYFDIDWDSPERKLTGIVLVPVLGDHYGRVLEAGDLHVARDDGSFVVRYGDHELPLSPRSLDEVLLRAAERAGSRELAAIATALGQLPHALIVEPAAVAERHRDGRALIERLQRLSQADTRVAAAIDAELAALNAGADALDALLRRQNFRLAFWRTASEELDYRRFFNIETLVGLRIEDERVFAGTHGLILDLVADGVIDGLRVDHVDGLRDPEGYLTRLRDATGGIPVLVEKILAPEEDLPEGWPVAGTTGYEWLNEVNQLFVASDNEAAMTAGYQAFSGETDSYDEVVHAAKLQIMREELAAEVERLTGLFAEVAERHRRHRDYTRRELRDALCAVIAAFPVYRTYARPGHPVAPADRDHIDQAIAGARAREPDLDPELFEFLRRLLLLEYPGKPEADLAARFQQLTSPVMAKGVEDTAFYRYNRLVSLNEVGGSPEMFGSGSDEFHRRCAEAAAYWPSRMITLATHDTKRGADNRARLNVLSEIPGPWFAAVTRWAEHNDRHRTGDLPDRNAEYLLYQAVVGAWPIEAERVGAYMQKATKEAKVHTSWVDPVAAYDDAVAAFVVGVMSDRWFVDDVASFLADHQVVEAGRSNSLAQTTLLLTCPGVADIYQGTELWEHSLVDPDNRRPVDYEMHRSLLAKLGPAGPAEALAATPAGGPKLWLVHRLLSHRRDRPDAYGARSGYRPLGVAGPKAAHAVALWRTGGVVAIVPRLVVGLGGDWAGTTVSLPEGTWTDVLSGKRCEGAAVALADLLAAFPVAVLADEER